MLRAGQGQQALPLEPACRPSTSASRAAPTRARARPRRATRRVMAALATDVEARGSGLQRPDASGRFGKFGGKYVPETLIPALLELEKEYGEAKMDPEFQAEFAAILKDYVGRESPLYYAERLSESFKREDGSMPRIYLKREDLNHTGAHKINNALGQVLLCKRMGKKRIIAETGAGQHGVATATVCARFGLKCIIYMGSKDMERQALNVFRMRLLGAEVRGVDAGTCTLKDATSEAIRDWVTNVNDTHYILGSAAGPHPYPMMPKIIVVKYADATGDCSRVLRAILGWIDPGTWHSSCAMWPIACQAGSLFHRQQVRDFQSMIGKETRWQLQEKIGRGPDVLIACVGGGSNAMGLFHEFVDDANVRFIGVEAAGEGVETDKHAATLTRGSPGVLHGSMSYLLQDKEGQIVDPHSISAGLDYPGVGPEHSFLRDIGRAEYHAVTDAEALEAFQKLSKLEGIIPALETSHALAQLEKLCPELKDGTIVVLNLSGRGDKDVNTVAKYLDV